MLVVKDLLKSLKTIKDSLTSSVDNEDIVNIDYLIEYLSSDSIQSRIFDKKFSESLITIDMETLADELKSRGYEVTDNSLSNVLCRIDLELLGYAQSSGAWNYIDSIITETYIDGELKWKENEN